jgi:hypothetical protein
MGGVRGMEAGVRGYALKSGGDKFSSESDSEGVCRNSDQFEFSKHRFDVFARACRHCG